MQNEYEDFLDMLSDTVRSKGIDSNAVKEVIQGLKSEITSSVAYKKLEMASATLKLMQLSGNHYQTSDYLLLKLLINGD